MRVVIEMPDSRLALDFLAWMCDGGGEQVWATVAPIRPGYWLRFEYDFKAATLVVAEVPDEQ